MSTTAPAAAPVPIDTTKVVGRRTLRFNSIDDILTDAGQLASRPVRQLGNWSLGQASSHLANAMKISLDGADFRAPLFIRLLAPLFKRLLLRGGLRPGYKLPPDAGANLIPANSISTEQGLAELKDVTERLHREPQRMPSPFLGKLTKDEWNQLHMRHAELHLSFFVPE